MKNSKLQIVTDCLKDFPPARERKNRYKTLWWMFEKVYGNKIESLSKEFFIDHGKTFFTISRLICKVQKEDESLRGSDYDDKEQLEQEAQIELGYTPGYHQDIKKLKTL
jgi:hypothetical protein